MVAGSIKIVPLPAVCTPFGRATGKKQGQTTRDAFFFRLDTPACLGVEEKKVCGVDAWREEQGLNPYIEINDKMLGILFHPNRVRKMPLNEGQVQKVMVSCYNLDLFREFIFKTRFLESFEIDADTRLKIETDDAGLSDFSFDYLDRTLFPDHIGIFP